MNEIRSQIEARPRTTVTAPAQTSLGLVAAQLLAQNNARRGLMIQNTGTTVIKLVLGTETPTQTVYHIALGAATAADDGLGATYTDDAWLGPVQGISSGAGGTLVITEIS